MRSPLYRLSLPAHLVARHGSFPLCRVRARAGLFSEALQVRDDLPARRFRQRTPGRHPAPQVAVPRNQKIWPSAACCTSLLRKLGRFPAAQGVRPMTLRAMIGKQSSIRQRRIGLSSEGIRPAAIGFRNLFDPRIVDCAAEQNRAKHHPHDQPRRRPFIARSGGTNPRFVEIRRRP